MVVDNASESIHCNVLASFVAFRLATFMWLEDLQSTLMPLICAPAITSELVQCNFSAWLVARGFVVKLCLAHILITIRYMFTAACIATNIMTVKVLPDHFADEEQEIWLPACFAIPWLLGQQVRHKKPTTASK